MAAHHPDRGDLRASDADREQVAEFLRRSCGEGRISADELDERLDAVFSARTLRELAPPVRDLPGGVRAAPIGATVARAPAARGPLGTAIVVLLVAFVLSGVLPVLLMSGFALAMSALAFFVALVVGAPFLLLVGSIVWAAMRWRPSPPHLR